MQQVLKLIEVDIGVRIVNQRIQKIQGFEDAHLSAVAPQERIAFLADKVVRLMPMVLTIEFADGVARRFFVVAIIALCLGVRDRIDLFLHEVLPGLDYTCWTRLIF